MNSPLSIADHLLGRARRFVHLGRTGEARDALRRLLKLAGLSVPVRSDALRLLGQVEVESHRPRPARRAYAAAIRLRPYDPELYSHYAAAVAADPDADLRKAQSALRRAVGIDPFQARYWAALGTLSVRLGRVRTAVRAFRRAARLRPADLGVLTEVVDGLVALDLRNEARRILNAARFRATGDAGVRDLENRLRFEWARRDQVAARRGTVGGPMLLPFPGRETAASASAAAPGIVRVDQQSRPGPHVLRMFGARPKPRRAR